MKKHFLHTLFLIICPLGMFGQISDFKEKFILPDEVKETSGLLFYNSKIITHNDSGDSSNLYEIDTISGNVVRTISISNASNIDWEDITQDDTHIFVADIGNNNGTRTDLKIYKVLKEDYKNSNSVSAEVISFSYEDQTDFSSSNSHNFDSEAIVVYQNNLLIFTKNRGDLKTNVYLIPKTIGNHTAAKVSTFNADGLVTGATYNPSDNSFMLSGYSSTLIPFLIYVGHNRDTGNDIFNNGAQKINLSQQIGQGSQIEGITFFHEGKYYLSREEVNSNGFHFPQKLYEFKNDLWHLLSVDNNTFSNQIRLFPNPSKNYISINYPKQESINKIEVFNSLGKKILNTKNATINISSFKSGVYFVKIIFNNNKWVLKKFIKL
ncbi:MAG: T9SS type A sorting domain-containing protein [Flavobacteriaceae bacterium]